jgi:hypothetical protein
VQSALSKIVKNQKEISVPVILSATKAIVYAFDGRDFVVDILAFLFFEF